MLCITTPFTSSFFTISNSFTQISVACTDYYECQIDISQSHVDITQRTLKLVFISMIVGYKLIFVFIIDLGGGGVGRQ